MNNKRRHIQEDLDPSTGKPESKDDNDEEEEDEEEDKEEDVSTAEEAIEDCGAPSKCEWCVAAVMPFNDCRSS